MKKLLGKKGSVLFLVVVVMSILIIAASATFYIVNNQSNSVNVRYSSEQSYQTALSVSNTVSDYIDEYLKAIGEGGKELDDCKDMLIGRMMSMSAGASANVTSEFDLSSIGMGKAEVVITKKPVKQDPTDPDQMIHVFEITTTSEYNGETIAITQVKEIVTGPAEYFTRFLTSTGKRPDDVLFSSHSILSEAYFENDYTRLGGGIAFTHLNHSLYSLGTIYDDGIRYEPGESKEIVIAQSYYVTSTGGGSLYADNIYVGGDLINGEDGDYNKTKAIYADDVYVLGDLVIGSNGVVTLPDGTQRGTTYYVNGDCHIWCGTQNSNIYVNGDIYLHSDSQSQGKLHAAGSVIFVPNTLGTFTAEQIEYKKDIKYGNGTVITASPDNAYTNKNFVYSATMTNPFSDSMVTNTRNHINSTTKRNKYEQWDAEQYFNDKFNSTGSLVPIRLDDTGDSHVELMKDSHNNPIWDSYIVTLNESCMISPAETWSWGNHTVIIDTSVNNEDIYIYLQPLAGTNTFSFSKGAANVNIYVKGKHSVIFVLPENVNFIMDNQSFIGHIDVLSALSKDNLSSADILSGNMTDRGAFNQLKYLTNEPAVGNPNTRQRLEDSLYVDGADGATKLVSSAFGPDAHNNIFLVTKGTKNSIDFSAQSTFLGYIYAPDAVMTASGAADGFAFLGGLIVGSYTYQTNATLAFTTPFDYHSCYPITKKEDIVKYLIKFANGGGVADPTGMNSLKIEKWTNTGYK